MWKKLRLYFLTKIKLRLFYKRLLRNRHKVCNEFYAKYFDKINSNLSRDFQIMMTGLLKKVDYKKLYTKNLILTNKSQYQKLLARTFTKLDKYLEQIQPLNHIIILAFYFTEMNYYCKRSYFTTYELSRLSVDEDMRNRSSRARSDFMLFVLCFLYVRVLVLLSF